MKRTLSLGLMVMLVILGLRTEGRDVPQQVTATSAQVVSQPAADPVPTPILDGRGTTQKKASRSRHSAPRTERVAPVRPAPVGAVSWAASDRVQRLRKCEGGAKGYRAVSGSGTYRGAYQMDRSFWLTYGGDPSLTADQAPPWMQDQVAYRGFLDRGWQPWTCARILGFI
jgi:hypothetical protein